MVDGERRSAAGIKRCRSVHQQAGLKTSNNWLERLEMHLFRIRQPARTALERCQPVRVSISALHAPVNHASRAAIAGSHAFRLLPFGIDPDARDTGYCLTGEHHHLQAQKSLWLNCRDCSLVVMSMRRNAFVHLDN
jgi:hypothetical protein